MYVTVTCYIIVCYSELPSELQNRLADSQYRNKQLVDENAKLQQQLESSEDIVTQLNDEIRTLHKKIWRLVFWNIFSDLNQISRNPFFFETQERKVYPKFDFEVIISTLVSRFKDILLLIFLYFEQLVSSLSFPNSLIISEIFCCWFFWFWEKTKIFISFLKLFAKNYFIFKYEFIVKKNLKQLIHLWIPLFTLSACRQYMSDVRGWSRRMRSWGMKWVVKTSWWRHTTTGSVTWKRKFRRWMQTWRRWKTR